MSLLMPRGGCASRRILRRTESGQRGFFLIETLILSVLVLGAAAACMAYRALDRARAASEAELTAAYLAQEQIARIEAQPASYLRAHEEVPWLGEGSAPLERNGVAFTVSAKLRPHTETARLAAAEISVSWSVDGRGREATFYKLVAYHE